MDSDILRDDIGIEITLTDELVKVGIRIYNVKYGGKKVSKS